MRILKFDFLIDVVLTLICTVAALAASAGDLQHISGRLTDVRGKPVAGVSVAIENSKTGQRTIVTTDKAGRFSADRLEPGSYSVKVEPLQNAAVNGIRLTLDSGERHSVEHHKKLVAGPAVKQTQ